MKTRLHIETAVRNGRNFLKTAYSTPPLKVANITDDKGGSALRLMLMSSSPGVLDGDHYNIQIDVGENASLQLETQSYQRLFQMTGGASQQMEVHLQNNSSFCYLPHPVVPHRDAIFSAQNKIFLGSGCSLLWGDVLTPGRQLHGEEYTFSKYHSVTEIFQNNRLVVKENLLLQPGVLSFSGMGKLEGFTHQASLLYLQAEVPMTEKKEVASVWLATQKAMLFGISLLPVNGLAVRILGNSGEQLFQYLKEVAALFLAKAPDISSQKPAHVR